MWKRLFGKIQTKPARIRKGLRIYAVGDVHGRVDLLNKVLARIDKHLAEHPASRIIEVFIGDYIDRGPASRDVIDRLIERSRTNRTIFLKGNHESSLIDFLNRPSALAEWQEYGGLETLISYGIRPTRNSSAKEQIELANRFNDVFPESHRKFIRSLKSSFVCGDLFFVHAGIRPGVPLSLQKEDDLLWIRDEFLLYEKPFEKLIIHGHSPVLSPEIRGNRVNIDTGAYATGKLTCAIFEEDFVKFL